MIIQGDCVEKLIALDNDSIDSLITDPPAGIGFMGKSWDSNKGGREEWIAWLSAVMRECHRVMKPGAHGLVWAIPRTSHWTGTALEEAGFEIRDVVTHLFGSGFPKSLDVSKAIDKANGDQRPIVGTVKRSDKRGGRMHACASQKPIDFAITSAASAASAAWQGWGTALKPACEFWFLVRKPISEKTVAKNVLKWGTGALNIDGSRIGFKSEGDKASAKPQGSLPKAHGGFEGKSFACKDRSHQAAAERQSSLGRFPANLVLSHSHHCLDDQCDIECAIAMLDGQSGFLHPAGNKTNKPANDYKSSSFHVSYDNKADRTYKTDKGGGASRFFYCAKVSPSERGDSKHPTMKSLKLMRYLCKLVTPPGGTILDPFMGSGSTGVAAKQEGFKFIGIEQEIEYVEIAKARINTAEARR